ncbi:MAG: hypothetical protein M1814_000944 [Vezdaea aestivalis]|nr:MAG: hypothetical protein M1814_000944 [Vezdaea aestivalis]
MYRSGGYQGTGRPFRGPYPPGSGTGFRGRGRGRGSVTQNQVDPLALLPKGELLHTLSNTDAVFKPGEDKGPEIKNCQYVSSYNWLDTADSVILVPGTPPRWTPPKGPQALSPDKGTYFRDQNSARYPKYPVEPSIKAVYALDPNFDPKNIDIFCCGSTMGSLLNFAEGSERSFRFNIEIVGNTAFLVRQCLTPKEVIQGIYGYGHTFPDAYTTWDKDVKNSASHQRIVKYNFGGLNCLMRFESDGYDPSKEDESENPLPREETSQDADLSTLLEYQFVSLDSSAPVSTAKLAVRTAGRPIRQSSIFDIKTRSARNPIDMTTIHPRLYFAQIPNFLVAYHEKGVFTTQKPKNVSDELGVWEAENRTQLGLLVVLLKKIVALVRNTKGKKVEVRRIGTGSLEITRLLDEEWTALPRSLAALWRGDEGASGLEDTWSDSNSDSDEDYLRF